MRLSLMKAAHAGVGSAPRQEIRIARPYRPTYATAGAGIFSRASAPLPDGMGQPPLMRGGIQHVDTPGVHMLGHLEDPIDLVIQ